MSHVRFSRPLTAAALASVFVLVAAGCSRGGDLADSARLAPEASIAQAEQGTGEAGLDTSGEAEPTEVDLDEFPGTGTTVTMARANWSTGYFQAALVRRLLEELGYRVSDPAELELSPSAAYIAMAEGDVDLWANSWYPDHLRWHEQEITDGTRAASQLRALGRALPDAGVEGLLVTAAVAEANQILSLDQINESPDLVALFDQDENGKAEILGCPAAWACDELIDGLIEFNEWSNLEQVAGDYDEMIDDAEQRVRQGEGVIVYSWSPSATMADLRPGENVLWLSLGEPAVLPEENTSGPAPVGPLCTEDPCLLGWAAGDITITANATWADSHPAATALLEALVIDPADVIAQNVAAHEGADGRLDLEAQVDGWFEANRAAVDGWLELARAAD